MKNRRTAIYARVSTEEQASQGFSIPAQIESLKDYAESKGLEIHEQYIDAGASGKNITDRLEMKRLLQDVKKGMYDYVLFYKLDRAARKLKDVLEIIDVLEQHNVKVYFHMDQIDTSSPSGKMHLQIMGSVAEFERNQIVDRVKMGMTQRAKQGKFNGGQCLGYDSIEKALVVNEEESIIIKEIFNLAEQGLGYKAIVARINHKGYKSKKGKMFSINAVKQILSNPMYIGKIRYNQVENWAEKRRRGKSNSVIITDGEHEPIISIEQWERVQSIRNKKSYKPKRSNEPYLLSGIIKCPMCGHGMVPGRSKGRNGESYRYYVCGEHHNKGKEACKANSIRADIAEKEVLDEISVLVSNPLVLKKIVDRVNREREHSELPILQEKKLIQSKLNQCKTKINNLLDTLAEGMISSSIIAPKLEQLKNEEDTLEQRHKELDCILTEADTTPVDFDSLRILLTDFQALLSYVDIDKQKALLRLVIKDIQINLKAPRHVDKINLHFDFTVEHNNNSYELMKQIYPSIEKDLELWRNTTGKYQRTLRTSIEEFRNVLPLLMVRFTPINPIPPINLL